MLSNTPQCRQGPERGSRRPTSVAPRFPDPALQAGCIPPVSARKRLEIDRIDSMKRTTKSGRTTPARDNDQAPGFGRGRSFPEQERAGWDEVAPDETLPVDEEGLGESLAGEASPVEEDNGPDDALGL